MLSEIYTGSVLDLSRFEKNSFDVVLCMGALYHLKDESKRAKAVKECLRVLKKGGVFVASYINKHAVILHNYEEQLKNIDELLQYSIQGVREVFYGSTPKEIVDLSIVRD